MGGDLRFELLGPLRVVRGVQEVRVTGRRQRLLLTVLLVEAPRVVSTARLVDALWEDGNEPADPINTVQQYVAHLRRCFAEGGDRAGHAVLQTSPPGYRMALEPGGLDSSDVAELSARARAATLSGAHDAAAQLAARALGLWRGQPLGEFCEHPFVLAHVDALEQRRLTLTELFVESLSILGDHQRIVEALGQEPAWPDRPALAAALVGALSYLGRQGDALAAAEAHRAAMGERGLGVSATFRQMTDDIVVNGRPRIDLTHLAVAQTPTSEVLRRLLVRAPTLDALPRGRDEQLDYQRAVIAALDEPSIAADSSIWLREMGRHEPGVLDLLDRAGPERSVDALALAVSYARYWDWIGQHRRLRAELARAVDATDRDTHEPVGLVAEAAGWLAYSFADVSAATSAHYLDLARHAASDDPLASGRVLAVESVIARRRHPERALQHGEAATRLLQIHGSAQEAAYAHVVSALAAVDAGLPNAAEWHAQQADDLYRRQGDRRGLAWLDVILARIHGTVADHASDFSAEHGEHTIRTMIDEGQRPR